MRRLRSAKVSQSPGFCRSFQAIDSTTSSFRKTMSSRVQCLCYLRMPILAYPEGPSTCTGINMLYLMRRSAAALLGPAMDVRTIQPRRKKMTRQECCCDAFNALKSMQSIAPVKRRMAKRTMIRNGQTILRKLSSGVRSPNSSRSSSLTCLSSPSRVSADGA
jgi:hypothetical protein